MPDDSPLLPWHAEPWVRVQRMRACGRLPHALLLSGPRGLGKARFAEALAHGLLCERPSGEGLACGACRACRLLAAGSHPDFAQVSPAEDGKVIRVDQIRELSDFLGYTSGFGGRKLVIVSPAERMNVNAANSLLKTLEEPPPRSLLLLVAERAAALPATVRSRCQTLAFAPPPAAAALAWLAPRVGDADPAVLLALAGGAPLAALAGAEGIARRRELFKTLLALAADQADPVRVAEAWLEGALDENLRWLAGWHMDVIRLNMATDPPRLDNPDLRAGLARLAPRLPAAEWQRRLDAVNRLRGLAATQVNAQAMLEDFFIAWAERIGRAA